MSIDMQQFNAIFFEEVAEHLTNMESLLLKIDVASPSLDDLNAIFRAAHSIKGGAGLFGFDDMISVTHILETLLDKLRKEELTLTSEMIDAFLKAGDILTAQKEVHQGGGNDVDEEQVKNICNTLDQLTNKSTELTGAIPSNTSSSADLPSNPTSHPSNKCITFTTEDNEDITHLLTELSLFGELSSESETEAGICKWQLTLVGEKIDSEELIDSISFFALPDSIVIDENTTEEEQCFGFFEELPSTESAFGLFDDDSQNVNDHNELTEQPPQLETKNEPQHQTECDSEAYGLFGDDAEEVVQPVNPVIKESALEPTTNKAVPISDTSIRVNTEKVDQLINQVGELVITQAMLMQIANEFEPSEHDLLLNRLTQLERNTRDLQESVMSIRMMPISFVFGRFPRVVRDLSNKLNKKIDLNLLGEETELDKGLVEQLADPLTHLIRNSIDHGIELPSERLAKGKLETGTITLSAFYEGGNVVINISDDGAGLNRHKIIEKAKERGLDVNSNMADSEVYQLIFSAGFSTADKVTDVSGRGVGMDVVKRNIHGMGGQVEIYSEAGVGSTISIRLPLTLAILDGMSISVAGQIYIIPLTFISESLQPLPENIKSINGKGTVVKVRGDYIPLLPLHKLFNIETEITQASDGILVLLEINNKKIALLVDQLEGQQQVVLKSLETNFHAVPFISGATIMGDGKVALILDVAGLVNESD